MIALPRTAALVPPRSLFVVVALSVAMAIVTVASSPAAHGGMSTGSNLDGGYAHSHKVLGRRANPQPMAAHAPAFDAAASMDTATFSGSSSGSVASGTLQRMTDAAVTMRTRQESDNSVLSGPVIQRDASIHGFVPDVAATAAGIGIDAATSLGGYVESNDVRDQGHPWGDDRRSRMFASLTLRVPSANFDKAVAAVKRSITARPADSTSGAGGGRVVSETATSRDVTAEYVDTISRQRTDEVAFAQAEALMTAATSVTDLLAVKHEMDGITQRLEATKAQRKYLENYATMAVLRVTLETEAPPIPTPSARGWSPLDTASRAFGVLAATVRNTVDVLIFSLVFALPIAVGVAMLSKLGAWIAVRFALSDVGRKLLSRVGITSGRVVSHSSGADTTVE